MESFIILRIFPCAYTMVVCTYKRHCPWCYVRLAQSSRSPPTTSDGRLAFTDTETVFLQEKMGSQKVMHVRGNLQETMLLHAFRTQPIRWLMTPKTMVSNQLLSRDAHPSKHVWRTPVEMFAACGTNAGSVARFSCGWEMDTSQMAATMTINWEIFNIMMIMISVVIRHPYLIVNQQLLMINLGVVLISKIDICLFHPIPDQSFAKQ